MINTHDIKLESINISDALRYMGYKSNELDSVTKKLIDECENDLLKVISPKFVYKVMDLKDNEILGVDFKLEGESIKNHLKGCTKVIFLCATLSAGADNLIRKNEILSMTKALITDALASAAIEQVCDKAEEIMLKDFKDYDRTWRFGIGYGDFELNKQNQFLHIVDAYKRAGVCVNNAGIMTPTKTVTCIIGLGHNLNKNNKKGCQFCNMKDNCQFKKEKGSCGNVHR